MGVLVTVTYTCGGCDAKAESAAHPVRREFMPLAAGNGGGLGLFRTSRMPNPAVLAPAGWMVFDPWTQCTYCPACWASIEGNAGGQR